VTAYRVWLALTRDAEARLRIERGEKQEALAALDSSIASLDALLTEQPGLLHVRGLLARSYGFQADLLKGMGEQAKADEALSKLRALREKFPGGGWPFPRQPRKDGEGTRETRDRGDQGNRPDRGNQPDREDPAP
jgi:hypothetical protein